MKTSCLDLVGRYLPLDLIEFPCFSPYLAQLILATLICIYFVIYLQISQLSVVSNPRNTNELIPVVLYFLNHASGMSPMTRERVGWIMEERHRSSPSTLVYIMYRITTCFMIRDPKHPKFNGNPKRDYGTNIHQPINHLMEDKK